MTVPILAGCDPVAAKLLTSRMRRLKLAETLKGIKVGCAVHCCCRWGCHSTFCVQEGGVFWSSPLLEAVVQLINCTWLCRRGKKEEEELCNKSYGGLLCLLRVWWPAVQVWERPAIAVTHLPTGEKWAKGYDLQLRFYSVDQYPQVGGGEWPRAADCVGVGRVGV